MPDHCADHLRALWLGIIRWSGKLVNLAGIPGIVRYRLLLTWAYAAFVIGFIIFSVLDSVEAVMQAWHDSCQRLFWARIDLREQFKTARSEGKPK